MSKIVNKPWGYEEIWAEAEHYVGKILHIDKATSSPYNTTSTKRKPSKCWKESWSSFTLAAEDK